MKNILTLLLIVFNCFCYAQLTTIPDNNFEYYLETHNTNGFTVTVGDSQSMGNGIVGDNLVLTNQINSAVNLSPGPNITDLTGIDDFTSLEYLYLYNNQITNLAVSIPSLGALGISNNNMQTMDISGCTNLWGLASDNNNLSSVDLSNNTALEEVYLNNNSIVGDLDLSNNGNLLYFEIKNNLVQNIDLRNRNSSSIPFEFDATQNSNLSCVFVDDTNNIPSGWIIDNTASFVGDEVQCNNLSVEDLEFNNAYIYPNPSYGSFKIGTNQQINLVEVLDLSGKVVAQFIKKELYVTTGLTKGLYILKIKTQNGIITEKLILK